MNWYEINKTIAKECDNEYFVFKKMLDSFKSKGVLPLQHIIYIDIFRRGDHDSVPHHLKNNYMKYIVRKIKKYMFDGILPHQNSEFTKHLFDKYGADHEFVQLFAFGFQHWTFELLTNVDYFITWICWIINSYVSEKRLQKILIYGANYNMMRIMSGMGGLQYIH